MEIDCQSLQKHGEEVGIVVNARRQNHHEADALAGAQDDDLLEDDGKYWVWQLHLGVHDVGVEAQGEGCAAVKNGQGGPVWNRNI